MKITFNNYETYALDYLEGNLTEAQILAFEAFLKSHPGIREELNEVNQVVLRPDARISFPDKTRLYRKTRGGIIPLWGVSRMVAAAVALLLISTATFFIWKSTRHPDNLNTQTPITNNSNPETIKPNLPATRIPMPENNPPSVTSDRNAGVKQPDTNVMAQNGNVSGRPEDIRPSSPALNSGNENRHPHPPKKGLSGVQRDKEFAPIPNLNSYDHNPELVKTDVRDSLSTVPNEYVAVSFLPVKPPAEINTKNVTDNLASNKVGTTRSLETSGQGSIKIHIPGEFLSDTWTDVSVASFKKKLIPQFIKNQLNL